MKRFDTQNQPESSDDDALLAELRQRADAKHAAGVPSFDDLSVDIAAEERAISSPELEALREIVGRQIDRLQPPPARSQLGRVRAKIEQTMVRANGPVPLLVRQEVNELSVTLLQYLATLSREIVSLRSQVAGLHAELERRLGTDATGGSDSLQRREAD